MTYTVLIFLQHQATRLYGSVLFDQGGRRRDWPTSVPLFEDSWPEVIERLGVLCALETRPMGEEELELFPCLPTITGGDFRRHIEAGGMRNVSMLTACGLAVRAS